MANRHRSLKFISVHRLGENRGSPRLWLESKRLSSLGFEVGSSYNVETLARGVRLSAALLGTHQVAKRRAACGTRPIIDLANRGLLTSLARWEEVKVSGFEGFLEIIPSVRAFTIHRQRASCPPWRTLEVFAGGGTLSAAISQHPKFLLTAGVEIDPRFADVWQAMHRDAVLIQADVRRIHPSEYPPHEILVAAIPCTSHSMLGRAKKSLREKPELGDSGDLFLSIAALVATHLPLACVFENVPSFATALAGQTLAHHLRRLGYHITQTILDPHRQWNEPQDRKRWLMVATLQKGFEHCPPNIPFAGDLSDILDPPGEQDRVAAERIAGSIEALQRHRERHRALGHGFGFSTINHQSKRVPTIVRSYHKINVGPFVETTFGPRLLRKHEVEKLMGCEIDCAHYATAIEILGQGVQTRVFAQILDQLSDFLCAHRVRCC
jgi:DNA (cytosine-5)-methyltransferase 1